MLGPVMTLLRPHFPTAHSAAISVPGHGKGLRPPATTSFPPTSELGSARGVIPWGMTGDRARPQKGPHSV